MNEEPTLLLQPRGPTLAARCPPKSSCTFVSVAVEGTLYVTVIWAKSSPDPEALSWMGADTSVIVPPYSVMKRSVAGSSWFAVESPAPFESATTVLSTGIWNVLALPPGQSAAARSWQRSALVSVKFQVASES